MHSYLLQVYHSHSIYTEITSAVLFDRNPAPLSSIYHADLETGERKTLLLQLSLHYTSRSSVNRSAGHGQRAVQHKLLLCRRTAKLVVVQGLGFLKPA
jgi:hypothetical protein